jgi:hypothetical protein
MAGDLWFHNRLISGIAGGTMPPARRQHTIRTPPDLTKCPDRRENPSDNFDILKTGEKVLPRVQPNSPTSEKVHPQAEKPIYAVKSSSTRKKVHLRCEKSISA